MTNTDKIQIGILHKNTKISRYKIPKHTNTNVNDANRSFIDTCWFSLEIFGFHWFFILTMKKPSLVMMRECPCSTKTRDGLENPSPPPSRFPLVMGFAPLDRGKSLEISLDPRDFPRASPSGNLSGLGKSWASGMDFPIHPSSWWSTDTVLRNATSARDFWKF